MEISLVCILRVKEHCVARRKSNYVRFKPDTAFSYDGLVLKCIRFERRGRKLRCREYAAEGRPAKKPTRETKR